uniref:Glycine--tRNA ligase beta subunit n=1 Tax=Candidatus Kentrum sp. FM TaxID=2126340 RepID=A0A450TMX2_9GAMM|nr:MAG: glycyl-tRNA synthetase beta chain [Candidatus Kentron sp. FM]VFJ69671.1 MAG: glycyl-tRNA synthetase beta chain [Candidatus Kentron sp. FM]VFK18794.1 MAG: glycyl-tRNA synthetase beta chain [Candidatus Kentron sp. FM]
MNPPRATLLVEIGTEELPPLALRRLSEALGKEIIANLAAENLGHGELSCFATPRRLAAVIADVETRQAPKETLRRGPARHGAFDAQGNPTRAALGFARSCGVAVEALEELTTEEGSWLLFRKTEPGRATRALLPAIVSDALGRLPVPKRMRWGDLSVEFARPVHWAVLLLGNEVIQTEIMGITAGGTTRGHRFHHPDPLVIEDPADYAGLLREQGRVVADFDERKGIIRDQVRTAAEKLGGEAIITEELLEEVTALVEWPVAVAGDFDRQFLTLPDKVLMGTMAGHQKYFPVRDARGNLMPHFITISNIQSHTPDSVRRGNERVVRPRLADAAFFFDADLRQPLADRLEELKSVVFQKRLGSLHDKSMRVAKLAGIVAHALGHPPEEVALASTAGRFCKCDLLTRVVGELPELQGYMGRIYSERTGENQAVAQALEEVYWPRFAGDAIPTTPIGRAVAIADKLDTLVGIFGIGQTPKGDRDPFALRRLALGALRILIEGELDLELPGLLDSAAQEYGEGEYGQGQHGKPFDTPEVTAPILAKVMAFMTERLRAYFSEQGIAPDVFAAVAARRPGRPLDFALRVRAVAAFRQLPEAASLAAANKRIGNILAKADAARAGQVNEALLTEDAERHLAARVAELTPTVTGLLARRDYTAAMTRLADLRHGVDAFFDAVLVMAEEQRVRDNRLALLRNIHDLFLATADISRLA